MTTTALTVAAIRKILNDVPVEDYLDAAIASTSATTFTPTDETLYAVGDEWEFDDDTGEVVLIRAFDPDTPTATVKRGHRDSVAATHADETVLLKNPRHFYDTISQAIQTVIDSDLYDNGVYDLIEHIVTSSVNSTYYAAPSTSCEEWLAVYQVAGTAVEPTWFGSSNFTRYPKNVDTTLYATGKVFQINRQDGVGGTDPYYVTCAHRLTLATLNAAQEDIVRFLACAYLLEWSEPRRLQGPTNQGDRTVRPGQAVGTAAYYRQLAERLIQNEKARLRKLNPPIKVWRR
jgi:hypothetical protein